MGVQEISVGVSRFVVWLWLVKWNMFSFSIHEFHYWWKKKKKRKKEGEEEEERNKKKMTKKKEKKRKRREVMEEIAFDITNCP
jgi:type III secretory pathway component EscU